MRRVTAIAGESASSRVNSATSPDLVAVRVPVRRTARSDRPSPGRRGLRRPPRRRPALPVASPSRSTSSTTGTSMEIRLRISTASSCAAITPATCQPRSTAAEISRAATSKSVAASTETIAGPSITSPVRSASGTCRPTPSPVPGGRAGVGPPQAAHRRCAATTAAVAAPSRCPPAEARTAAVRRPRRRPRPRSCAAAPPRPPAIPANPCARGSAPGRARSARRLRLPTRASTISVVWLPTSIPGDHAPNGRQRNRPRRA